MSQQSFIGRLTHMSAELGFACEDLTNKEVVIEDYASYLDFLLGFKSRLDELIAERMKEKISEF